MSNKIFFFLLLTFSMFYITSSIATVRYVSKTGTSVAPYTSWATSADSIQKAINICVTGDTVIVANGIYYESIYVDKTINLWGSSMDSTIIDGSNISATNIVYFSENNSTLKNFNIIGLGRQKVGLNAWKSNIDAEDCRIKKVYVGLTIGTSLVNIKRFIIEEANIAIRNLCSVGTCNPVFTEFLIYLKNSIETAVVSNTGGSITLNNNIIIGEGSSQRGVSFESQRRVVFKNNLISGFKRTNMSVRSHSDTVFVINNNSMNVQDESAFDITYFDKTVTSNNIIKNANIGFYGGVKSEYNLFDNVTEPIAWGAYYGDGNVFADPMFVNDTLPTLSGTYDLHLQKYSPAIDKGDPNILDIDGSRSDIGMFGGPLGQRYTYQNLAPKPPRNLTASLDSGLVHLKWNKNTEADLFRYRVYRDTVPDFIYDTTKIIAVLADTFYYDDVPDKFNAGSYYYKTTAIDSAINQSAASEEVHVIITGIPEAPPVVVEHYKLLQNYPNPFNPTTTIPYRLKEPGYVKVMVYNIVGELVRVLVNGYQGSGYYEVEFNPNQSERKKAEGYVEFETGYYGNVASGIYLYRIEVIGEGRIPRFSDMKKMILLK